MSAKSFLTHDEIRSNIKKVRSLMDEKGLGSFYISSFDPFLNEYVPIEDCHRYYLTGFTGSTAEVLIVKDQKVKLYVDGRYFEQADLEVDANDVEVVKVGGDRPEATLSEAILNDLITYKSTNIAVEGERTPLAFYNKLSEKGKITSFGNELSAIIDFKSLPALKEVKLIESKYCGEDTKEKLEIIFENSKAEGYFLTALDDVAWISNCRGYHLPYQSAFCARALATDKKVYIFVEKACPISTEASKNNELEFIATDGDLDKVLTKLQGEFKLQKLFFDPALINSADYNMIDKIFSEKVVTQKDGGLVPYRSAKTSREMLSIEDSFNRSNKAIFNTISWVREQIKSGKKVSEIDMANKCKDAYFAEGANELSFGTISAIGASGSIIHYGNPSKDIIAKDDDLLLLDSGAYYDGGFATDTTRAFLATADSTKASSKHKTIYTLVLKGLLNAQNSIFPEGTVGAVIDGQARLPITQHGYNYGHGTGHGVGINVHEGGIRLSPISNMKIEVDRLVSIEPGIYIPGFGGVRLENIALVEKHPEFEGMLRFKNMVWIGFDHTLIDQTLMNDDEKRWLDEYESECKTRGTSFLG